MNSIVWVHDRMIEKIDFEEKEIKLGHLHKYIDCDCVDVLSINGYDFWFDDEGKLKDGWIDRISLAICKKDTGEVLDTIVGDCVICKSKDSVSIPMKEEDTEKLLEMISKKVCLYSTAGDMVKTHCIYV